MKRLLWIVAAIPLLILLLVGAVIVNVVFFDDKLDTKIAVMGELRAPSMTEAQNGYFAMLAMAAGDGADGHAYARAWLAEARAAAKENRATKLVAAKRAKRPDLCHVGEVSCLAAAQGNMDSINDQLDAYKEDLERYEQLIAFRAYEEVLDYPASLDPPYPPYGNTVRAQRAWLMRAVLAVQAGRIEDALSAVERDIVFQQVILAGAHTIIGKSVSLSDYMRDLAFVTDLLQTRSADLKPFAPRLTEMLKPIAPAALRVEAVHDTRFGRLQQWLKNPGVADRIAPGSVPDIIGARFFYKPNATINEFYRIYIQDAELLRKPPAVLARDGLKPASKEYSFWAYIDNPLGCKLLDYQVDLFESKELQLRLHDLDAYNRLLGLGVEIIAAGVGAEGVADFVAKSDARFYDPYTGKPMAWDAGSKQLSFKPEATRKHFNMDKGRLFLQV